MKKDKRGGAGRGQGRKPTGRLRKWPLSAKFTNSEKQEIIDLAGEADLTQSDFILKKCRDKG